MIASLFFHLHDRRWNSPMRESLLDLDQHSPVSFLAIFCQGARNTRTPYAATYGLGSIGFIDSHLTPSISDPAPINVQHGNKA